MTISVNGGNLFSKAQNTVTSYNNKTIEEENKISEAWSKVRRNNADNNNNDNVFIADEDAGIFDNTSGTLIKSWADMISDGNITVNGNGEITAVNLGNISQTNIKLVIPNSITDISFCFSSWNNLTSVVIPSSVLNIPTCAFSECEYLTNVTLTNGITSIEYGAFDSCSSLESITIPKSVTNIADGAFTMCYNLSNIKVENGNPNYDSRQNCNAIIETNTNKLVSGCKNTFIPNSVTSISDNAFYGSGLTNITIPSNVRSIGAYSFAYCVSLTDVTIERGLTSIGFKAFYYCNALTGITIPDTVETIESDAFLVNRNVCQLTNIIINKPQNSIDGSPWGAPNTCHITWQT